MTDITDLRSTIVPKSDQLNSEQLLAGPITITVTDVTIGSAEQPISVHYEGENGRPYKPCKTCRKALIFAWGPDGRDWAGRSMTLYCDPQVKFGGDEVGGIRISAMSDIDRDVQLSLTATRGKKALHVIKRLQVASPVDHKAALTAAATVEALKDAFRAAYRSTADEVKRADFKKAYDARMAALTAPPVKTLDELKAEIDNATSAETASLVLDGARDVLTPEQYEELGKSYDMAWAA